ncbi:glycosyltransferase [Frankia sp. Cppng1_Ct_nod]|uniref:glycosyltransferase n=1 Tax=Frankia sp. Cppng1_Ct_nod TaxID=2897162 RepID=UPI002023FE18|nr:glycosyltransferase [Frankia sp. Cppng1_Ct_nod]
MTVIVSFAHLLRLSDDVGLFEHALGAVPRREHGYCVDDVARGLVVLAREPDPAPELVRLLERYLAFVVAAQAADGAVRNRRGSDGRWRDEPGLGDWWGRALWGLGTVAARAPTSRLRLTALARFRVSARRRSPWPRAMTFAALGAGEVLLAHPDDDAARALLAAAVTAIGPRGADPTWPWPEPALRYANAAVPEALILAGTCLPDEAVGAEGLRLLAWLLAVETRAGRLSLTPVGGSRPGDGSRPRFDQQPIEAAALADACARAYDLTGEPRWLTGLRRAEAWFLGDNDSATPLLDTATGGGCDGLERDGRNTNQGAESTLAWLSTAQHARRLVAAP